MSKDDLKEKLKDFLTHDDELVRDVANEILMLYDGVYNESLSQEQLHEVVEDLMQTQEVRRMADNLERKIKVLQAFNVIKTIIGIIPK